MRKSDFVGYGSVPDGLKSTAIDFSTSTGLDLTMVADVVHRRLEIRAGDGLDIDLHRHAFGNAVRS